MSDDYGKLGPISESAIRNVDRIAQEQGHHATVEVDADKTITAEAGGTIKGKISWTAYAKKVWKGPLTAGSTWKW